MTIPREKILELMQDIVENFLIPKFNELGMNATGEWLSSLEVDAGDNVGYIKGRPYTEQLQNGRMPGAMPPIEPIEKWVNAKFGLFGTEARSAAFAISKKIADSGTTWYQKGGSGLLDVLNDSETIRYINDRISNFMNVEVTLVLRRELQEIF